MQKYELSLNSGFSSCFPSFSLEYFEKYTTTIKANQTSCVPMYSQVQVAVTQACHLGILSAAMSVHTKQNITNAQTMMAEISVTTGLKLTRNRPMLNLKVRHLVTPFSSSWASAILYLRARRPKMHACGWVGWYNVFKRTSLAVLRIHWIDFIWLTIECYYALSQRPQQVAIVLLSLTLVKKSTRALPAFGRSICVSTSTSLIDTVTRFVSLDVTQKR